MFIERKFFGLHWVFASDQNSISSYVENILHYKPMIAS